MVLYSFEVLGRLEIVKHGSYKFKEDFLAARLPGLVLVNPGTGSVDVLPSQLRGHTALFTFINLPPITL